MSVFNFFKDFYLKSRLNDPTRKSVFDHYFFDHNYYLQKNASTEDFAPILNLDTQSLDKMAVAYYGQSFTMLINEYRYNHFVKELIHPINENVTIDSLIKLSGFDNNESFVKYAKEKQQNASTI
jgi:hypothetical protein